MLLFAHFAAKSIHRDRIAVFALPASVTITQESDQSPPKLFTLLSETLLPEPPDDGGPIILKSSVVLLDEQVLAMIDPSESSVSDLPLVHIELFDDAKFDVEFRAGRPRWVEVLPVDPETFEPNPPDGFVFSGRIVGSSGGYVVIVTRPGAVLRGHLNGFGEFRLRALDAGLYEAINFWALGVEHGCDHGSETSGDGSSGQTSGPMADGNGNCDGDCPTGCTGDCDDGCVIDLMVIYTRLAREEYEAAHAATVEEFIIGEVATFTEVLIDSGIAFGTKPDYIFRLVHMREKNHFRRRMWSDQQRFHGTGRTSFSSATAAGSGAS